MCNVSAVQISADTEGIGGFVRGEMSNEFFDPRLRHTILELNQAQTLSLFPRFASGAETGFGFWKRET